MQGTTFNYHPGCCYHSCCTKAAPQFLQKLSTFSPSANQLFSLSLSASSSVSQSVSQSDSQSIWQSVNLTVSQSIWQSVSQSDSQSFNLLHTQCLLLYQFSMPYGFRLQMSAVCAEIHEIHSSSSRHCLLVFTSSEFSRSQIVPAQQT